MFPNIQPPFTSSALISWVCTKFCFKLKNFFKTQVKCIKQSTFLYGNLIFLGYTMLCPLFFLSIEGVVILYFVYLNVPAGIFFYKIVYIRMFNSLILRGIKTSGRTCQLKLFSYCFYPLIKDLEHTFKLLSSNN